MRKLNKIVKQVLKHHKEDIDFIAKSGSDFGLKNPHLSDIDLVIIAKRKSIHKIMNEFRECEHVVYGISHSPTTDFMQKHFIVTPDLKGLHLIFFSEEEFDKEFNAKSLRLKILSSTLASRRLFLYNLTKECKILHGPDYVSKVNMKKFTLGDRILSVPLSYLILLALPFTCWNKNDFKIWCFKIPKFLTHNIHSYTEVMTKKKVSYDKLGYDMSMHDLSKKYRYKPEEYKGSLPGLYFKAWKTVLKNTSFIWRGVRLN